MPERSPAPAKKAWGEGAAAFALLLAVYLFPWGGPGRVPVARGSRDALGNRLIAASWLSRASSDIRPYFGETVSGQLAEHVLAPREPNSPWSPRYPVGTALLAAPFFAGVPKDRAACLAAESAWSGLAVRERIAAAFLAAFAAGLFHVLLRRGWPKPLPRGQAVLATAALGLSTPFWSANAGALWSHAGSAPLLIAMLCMMFKPGGKVAGPAGFACAGALAGLAAWCRPTHLATIAIIPLVLAASLPWRGKKWRKRGEERSRTFPASAFAFAFAAAFLLGVGGIGNSILYQNDPLGPYLRGLFELGAAEGEPVGASLIRMAEAAAGTLVSPGAGLFFHCPILLLALGGVAASWRLGLAGRLALAVAGVQLALAWRNPIWWGGWCWGPRVFADVAPFLLLIGLPALETLAERRRLWLAWLLVAAGAFFQWVGVAKFDQGWFFERSDNGQTRELMWSPTRSPLPDALREGRPAERFEPAPGDWQREAFDAPEWLQDHLKAPRAEALRLDVDKEGGAWTFASGLSPTGRPLPYRPIPGLRWQGAFQYRDRLNIPLAGAPLELAERGNGSLWLLAAFPAGGPQARIVSGAANAELAEAKRVEVSGRALMVYLWRVEPAPGAAYLAIERPRPFPWRDPLATVPPVDMIGVPCFVAPAE